MAQAAGTHLAYPRGVDLPAVEHPVMVRAQHDHIVQVAGQVRALPDGHDVTGVAERCIPAADRAAVKESLTCRPPGAVGFVLMCGPDDVRLGNPGVTAGDRAETSFLGGPWAKDFDVLPALFAGDRLSERFTDRTFSAVAGAPAPLRDIGRLQVDSPGSRDRAATVFANFHAEQSINTSYPGGG